MDGIFGHSWQFFVRIFSKQMSKRVLPKRHLGVLGMNPGANEHQSQTPNIHMQYTLLFAEPAEEFAKRDNPDLAPAYWGAWGSYVQAVEASGIVVNGAGLQPPSTATMLRIRDGKRQIHDGPYPESKEILGGFFVIEVASLDVALEWAAKSPAAQSGSVEIRPVLPPPPNQPA